MDKVKTWLPLILSTGALALASGLLRKLSGWEAVMGAAVTWSIVALVLAWGGAFAWHLRLRVTEKALNARKEECDGAVKGEATAVVQRDAAQSVAHRMELLAREAGNVLGWTLSDPARGMTDACVWRKPDHPSEE